MPHHCIIPHCIHKRKFADLVTITMHVISFLCMPVSPGKHLQVGERVFVWRYLRNSQQTSVHELESKHLCGDICIPARKAVHDSCFLFVRAKP